MPGPGAAFVERVLAGDTEAFAPLVDRYQRVLFTVALRMLGNRADAADVTQTAFVKAFEKLGSYNPQAPGFSAGSTGSPSTKASMSSGRGVRWNRSMLTTRWQPRRLAGSSWPSAGIGSRRPSCSCRPTTGKPSFSATSPNLSYDEIAAAVAVPVKTVKSRLYSGRQRPAGLWELRMRPDHDDDRDDPVSRWLGQLGGAEPPATLAAEVMRRVRHHARGRHHAVRPQTGGTVMAEEPVGSGGGGSHRSGDVHGITGFPQLNRGYRGDHRRGQALHGPANQRDRRRPGRHLGAAVHPERDLRGAGQGPEQPEAAVESGDARIAAPDDALMSQLTQMADLQQVAAADARLNIFADNNVRLALANEAFARAITDPGVVSALQRPEVAAAVSRNDLESAAISAEVRARSVPSPGATSPQRAIRNDVFRSQLANAAMARALQTRRRSGCC